jgi:hypothetical protein
VANQKTDPAPALETKFRLRGPILFAVPHRAKNRAAWFAFADFAT